MAGTFTITGATGVESTSNPNGTPWGGGAIGIDPARAASDAALLAGINSLINQNPSLYAGWCSGQIAPIPIGTWLARFTMGLNDAVISLDGGPLISYNSLPAGIVVATATLNIKVGRYASVSEDPAGDLFLQRSLAVQSSDLNQVSTLVSILKQFVYDFTPLTYKDFASILLDGFGIKVVFTIAGSIGQYFNSFSISGTYEILLYSWTLDPVSGSTIEVGDIITLTSPSVPPPAPGPGDTAIDLMKVTPGTGTSGNLTVTEQVRFQNADGSWSTRIRWRLDTDDDPEVEIDVTGDGTQFSGTIPLGVLSVLTTNGSGIYRIVKDKRHDTLYSSLRDGTTRNVKIPDPFIKTGYIGG